ncbi:AIDA repeat-containing protein, partial [Escherichia coli]
SNRLGNFTVENGKADGVVLESGGRLDVLEGHSAWKTLVDDGGITVTRNSPTGQAMTTDAEAAVSEALRDLAFWLYRQLENEYDWLTSDAAVDEALLINEYTFTEAGLRAGCPVIVKLSFTDFL